MKIDAEDLHYKELNDRIRKAVESSEMEIEISNVNGHRYIGAGLKEDDLKIGIEGVPGNDLAAFMDGPEIKVRDNVQDAVGNTMNSGKVVIDGSAGDVIGHSMRGGSIYVRGDAGCRSGIHMKAYKEFFPVVIIGGSVQDFFGEYMAGGLLVVLGIDRDLEDIVGDYVGTGMHGGEIYVRGAVEDYQLGEEVGRKKPDKEDIERLRKYLDDYSKYFDLDNDFEIEDDFVRLVPKSHRPYGKIYTY